MLKCLCVCLPTSDSWFSQTVHTVALDEGKWLTPGMSCVCLPGLNLLPKKKKKSLVHKTRKCLPFLTNEKISIGEAKVRQRTSVGEWPAKFAIFQNKACFYMSYHTVLRLDPTGRKVKRRGDGTIRRERCRKTEESRGEIQKYQVKRKRKDTSPRRGVGEEMDEEGSG